MTNHIEQLMKAAGVKPRFYMQVNVGDLDCNFQEVSENTLKKLWDNWSFHLDSSSYWMEEEDREQIPENYEDFKKSDFWEKKYPAFTPEKQLKLIKLIMKAGNIDNIHQYYYEISKMFVFECRSLPELGTYNQWSTQNVNYELALAELVLILINENKLDKSEVRRILEND